MACQFTDEEITELQSLVEARIDAAEAASAGASHSNQALMQDEIDLLMTIQDELGNSATGACVFDLLQINELLGLVSVRLTTVRAASNNARSHSNMALMDEEGDLLDSIEGKLEAAAATAAAPAGFPGGPNGPNNNAAAVNAVVAVNAAANANANAAVANAAAVNAVVQAAAAENAARNAGVSYSNNYHPLGGRRRRHPRKTRKGRKASKKSRKGRKGTRRGRKGSRRA